MSMSMGVTAGYGVVFRKDRPGMTAAKNLYSFPTVPMPDGGLPWDDDDDLKNWWAKNGKGGCPVTQCGSGGCDHELVPLFLTRTVSKGMIGCRIRTLLSDALMSDMERFLKAVGLTVPVEAYGWFAVGDFGG